MATSSDVTVCQNIQTILHWKCEPHGGTGGNVKGSLKSLGPWINTKKQKCQPADGTRANVRGSPKSQGFILWGTWIHVQNCMAIHPIVVEIFFSGPKCQTNCSTNFATSSAMLPSWLKRCRRLEGGWEELTKGVIDWGVYRKRKGFQKAWEMKGELHVETHTIISATSWNSEDEMKWLECLPLAQTLTCAPHRPL